MQNDDLRKENLKQIHHLYEKLEIIQKHSDFSTIFMYKAMNLSGIGLKDEEFGKIRKGKYVQIISIAYETDSKGKRIPRNLSLGYYGKAEKINQKLKNEIIEFILRWRYEKIFQQRDNYQELISRLKQS